MIRSLHFTYRIYRYILPSVAKELRMWRRKAEMIPDSELRKQAIASMTAKRFHCEGGSIYAVAALSRRHVLIPLIVSLQTISDYLDNLCDRSTSLDPDDFRQLHAALLDAITPGEPKKDYYRYRKEKDDAGYLYALVDYCQRHIVQLPQYDMVREQVREWVGLYCDLQVHKHVHPEERERRLHQWWENYRDTYAQLLWQEFAAATGSTLGVFTLFLAASRERLEEREIEKIRTAYFPWISGLHILLDYLIDQDEDRQGGDLNFVHYYADVEETIQRLDFFARQARKHASNLPDAPLHSMVVEALLGLYLADKKVRRQKEVYQVSRKLLKDSPFRTLFFFLNSRLYRG